MRFLKRYWGFAVLLLAIAVLDTSLLLSHASHVTISIVLRCELLLTVTVALLYSLYRRITAQWDAEEAALEERDESDADDELDEFDDPDFDVQAYLEKIEDGLGFENSDKRYARQEKEHKARLQGVCTCCGKPSFGTRSQSSDRWFSYCAACINGATKETNKPVYWAREKDVGPFVDCTEAYTHFTFELNVPSGVMVVGNDFRGHFRSLGSFESRDSIGDSVKEAQAMARIGCAHAYVGNSCPSVYRVAENKFAIASTGSDPETDEDLEHEGEQVASICTDLWWYSIVDKNEYDKRGCNYSDAQLVSCRPGVYRFTHQVWRDGWDKPEPELFATFEWIREADPVRDFAAEWRAMNFTSGQIIHRGLEDWPSLYGGDDGIQKKADHIFCVLGGGGNWHENGFVLYNPATPKDEPEVEIPDFDKKYWWYPLSDHSALWAAAEGRLKLNPSFATLAIKIALSRALYGNTDKQTPEAAAKETALANQCFEKLVALYPEAANA